MKWKVTGYILEKSEKGWSSESIESKGESVLNEKRNFIQDHERQCKDSGLDWIGLDSKGKGKTFKHVKHGTGRNQICNLERSYWPLCENAWYFLWK